jgi:aryl-alcohol dehydrogenase-like predicted oxidoreductase
VELPRRPLGSSGVPVTVTGFSAWAIGGGGWAFGWGPRDDTVSHATMRHALAQGLNWIDTVAVYGLGHSEQVVGQLLRQLPPSKRPLVFTKCELVPGRTRGSRTPIRSSVTSNMGCS